MDQDQHGTVARLGSQGPPIARLRAARSLAHADLPRRTALRPAHRALRHGPINAHSFRAYVDQLLAPTLRPGDIVIMDNLGSHKSTAVPHIIKATGARLWFLPPYSPDLNPIEQAFAKIKHWMRMAQKRCISDTCQHIGALIDTLTPDECTNYLLISGSQVRVLHRPPMKSIA
jgi:transposase